MSKALKIGGIVVLAIIILLIAVSFFSKLFLGAGVGLKSSGITLDMPSRNASFSNSLSIGSAGLEEVDNSAGMPLAVTEPAQDLTPMDKKIIKSGNLNLKVDNANQTMEKISEIAKSNGGEVFASNFYQSKNNIRVGTITVKVPMANFETAFAEIKEVASVVIRESTSGQDVTEQYIDLVAQLKNRQAEEQSFIKILNQAQKIDDVLAVTRELARVRGNIEQLQGRIKYLESQTDMSTIAINLTEDENITVVDSWRPFQVAKEAFNALIKGLQSFVDFLIRLLIVVIPLLLIWLLIFYLIYRGGKKIYLKIKNRSKSIQ
jgi:hypothetical protein